MIKLYQDWWFLSSCWELDMSAMEDEVFGVGWGIAEIEGLSDEVGFHFMFGDGGIDLGDVAGSVFQMDADGSEVGSEVGFCWGLAHVLIVAGLVGGVNGASESL
jgi:hypothetical protein